MPLALPPLKLDHRPVVIIFRSPVFNSSETFVQAHATSLRRYQPLIVGLERKGNVVAALEGRVLFPETALERTQLRLFGPSPALVGRLRQFRPVIVHAHFGPDGVAALPLARALGIPLVTTLHGYEVSHSPRYLLTSGRLSWMRYALARRRLTRRGELFVAVSEALRRRALDQGYPGERTIAHLNGVDLSRFPPVRRRAEEGLILHVGRLVEKKGTGLLIEAVAQVSRALPRARLVIAGEGPMRPRLQAKAALLDLSERITFLGERSQAEVAEWMERAWLLAVPSLTAKDGDAEGLPTVIFEAAAAGLPVVASDHSGNSEGVRDGDTGFIVPEDDAGALAARMLDLLRSPPLRDRMAHAARTLAEARYDAVRQTGVLEAHYDRLIAERRR